MAKNRADDTKEVKALHTFSQTALLTSNDVRGKVQAAAPWRPDGNTITPDHFTVALDRPVPTTLRFERGEDGYVCTDIHLQCDTNAGGIPGTALDISVDAVRDAALRAVALDGTEEDGGYGSNFATPSRSELRKHTPGRGRPKVPNSRYEEAARVYARAYEEHSGSNPRQAHRDGIAALEEMAGSNRTAYRYWKEARDRGLLPG